MENFFNIRELYEGTIARKSTWKEDTEFFSFRGRCISLITSLESVYIVSASVIQFALQILSFLGALIARNKIKEAAKKLAEAFCVTLLSPFSAAYLSIRGVAGAILFPGITLRPTTKDKYFQPSNVQVVPEAIEETSKANQPPQGKSPFEKLPDSWHTYQISTFLSPKDLSALSQTNKANTKRVHSSPAWKKLIGDRKKIHQEIFKDFICFEHFKNLPTVYFEEFGDRYTLSLQKRKVEILINNTESLSLKKLADQFSENFKKAFAVQDKDLIGRIVLKAKDGSVMHGLFGQRILTRQMFKNDKEPVFYYDLFLPTQPISYAESNLIGNALLPFFPTTNVNPAVGFGSYRSYNSFGKYRAVSQEQIKTTIKEMVTIFMPTHANKTPAENTQCAFLH